MAYFIDPCRTYCSRRALLRLTWLALTALSAAEVTARLDDWLFGKVPLFASPHRWLDLNLVEAWGPRGRPHGMYRKWQLNSYGFLGAEISDRPAGRRIMVLGASESFGLYESRGNDYPHQLGRMLNGDSKGQSSPEVVNASMAGLALPTMRIYWENWASKFGADTVLIYPAAHFYLDKEAPSHPVRLESPPPEPKRWPSPRIFERINDQLRTIWLIRYVRREFILYRALSGEPPEYLFTPQALPNDRMEAYVRDLESLCESIARHGADPVILTQAFKTPIVPTAEDRSDLQDFRIFMPRALPDAIPAFIYAARDATIELGARRNWKVIDVAGEISGRRELFADPVHFNDKGSELVARIISGKIGDLGQLTRWSGRGAPP